MQFSHVNETLLIRAAELLVGPQMTKAIMELYIALDRAALDGYDLGHEDGNADADKASEAAFDRGFEEGRWDSGDEDDYCGDPGCGFCS